MGLWINRNRGGDSRRRVGNPALVLLLTDFSFTAQLAVLLHISLQPVQELSPFTIGEQLRPDLVSAPIILVAIVGLHATLELFFIQPTS